MDDHRRQRVFGGRGGDRPRRCREIGTHVPILTESGTNGSRVPVITGVGDLHSRTWNRRIASAGRFTALQASVQHDLANQLRPAAERIREPVGFDLVGRHLQLEQANVQSTLRPIDAALLDDVVRHLADPTARVYVLSGDASRGVAQQLVVDLLSLRDDVQVLDGNDIAVRRQIALLRPTDVLVAVDFRRYERWVVDAAAEAAAAGVWTVAVTDSLLSPLSAGAQRTFVVAAAGAGPFDSHVGTLSVFNLLVTGVADQLRAVATERLDRLETVWQQSLTDR
jgi:DNA-binding MurR/RpiR family transcriptional regulator